MKPIKEYWGDRLPNNEGVTVTVWDGQRAEPLKHHVMHSPAGFEWGYEGSGPADLARCILIDYFSGQTDFVAVATKLADKYYQGFKRNVIATIPGDRWLISEVEIEKWVQHEMSKLEGGGNA